MDSNTLPTFRRLPAHAPAKIFDIFSNDMPAEDRRELIYELRKQAYKLILDAEYAPPGKAETMRKTARAKLAYVAAASKGVRHDE